MCYWPTQKHVKTSSVHERKTCVISHDYRHEIIDLSAFEDLSELFPLIVDDKNYPFLIVDG